MAHKNHSGDGQHVRAHTYTTPPPAFGLAAYSARRSGDPAPTPTSLHATRREGEREAKERAGKAGRGASMAGQRLVGIRPRLRPPRAAAAAAAAIPKEAA